MTKVITSPVKRFPGTVTLPDFLTFPQAVAWEKAQGAAADLRAGQCTDAELLQAWQPGLNAVVITWNLENYDPTNPPATPRKSVIELTAWLLESITALYEEAETVPNE